MEIEPQDKARELIRRHGPHMALLTARRWLEAFGPHETKCAYWAAIVRHLMAMEHRPGRPHTKAEKRRLRSARAQEREARA